MHARALPGLGLVLGVPHALFRENPVHGLARAQLSFAILFIGCLTGKFVFELET